MPSTKKIEILPKAFNQKYNFRFLFYNSSYDRKPIQLKLEIKRKKKKLEEPKSIIL